MHAIQWLLRWFAGGSTPYRTLFHCMSRDYFWIVLTVALDLAVATGYTIIAFHWWRNQKSLAPCPAKDALRNMKNIFIFCGICGYLFIPVKMYWPAWRLYDMFMAVLAFYTWRYAFRSRELAVVYTELGRSNQLARDLEKSRAEAARKSYFLNAISHDMRTPLNSLSLQASLAELNLETADTDGLREAIGQIKSTLASTTAMLEDFLELGRLDWAQDSSSVTNFDLADSLKTLLGDFQARAAHKGLELRHEIPRDLWLFTDRIKMERIVRNLVDNALKFTAQGHVSVRAEVRGANVLVMVADTGVGIAGEDQARLFEEFYQVHNRERDGRKGFGLGLAIARRLAEQLGGELSVESRLGEGTCFTLTLRGAFIEPRTLPGADRTPSQHAQPSTVAPG